MNLQTYPPNLSLKQLFFLTPLAPLREGAGVSCNQLTLAKNAKQLTQHPLPHARSGRAEALKTGDDPVVDGQSILIVQDTVGPAADVGEDQECGGGNVDSGYQG